MSTSVRASAADLRVLAGLVSQDRPDVPPKEGLPRSLLADLAGQIRCDALHFFGMDSGRRRTGLRRTFRPSIHTGGRTWIGRCGSITGLRALQLPRPQR